MLLSHDTEKNKDKYTVFFWFFFFIVVITEGNTWV